MLDQSDRRHPRRLSDEAYEIGNRVVFITIDARRGRSIFCTDACAPIVADCMKTGCEINNLDPIAYCIMPDHVHIVVMTRPGGDFLKYLKGFKWAISRRLHAAGVEGSIWQRSYWDRHHRDDEDVATMITYVMNNPVRKGLCRLPEDWPYSEYLGLPR